MIRIARYTIKKFSLNTEIYIFSIISLLLIALSASPYISFHLLAPANTEYTFLHNSISDYPYYVSFTNQGVYGRTTTIDQFTSESQSPGFIHIFYLWLGVLGRIFGLSAIMTYFAARILLGLVFLFTAHAFISYFIKEKWLRIISFLLFSLSHSFPRIATYSGVSYIEPYLNWWTEIDPIGRATFIPHFLMGHIGLTGCLLLLMILFRTRMFVLLIPTIILGMITGLAHPPSLGMVYYIAGTYLLMDGTMAIMQKKWKKWLTRLGIFGLFTAFTIPTLLYILSTTDHIFPWTLMKAQESLFYALSLPEYILAIGPLFFLGLSGILFLKWKNIPFNHDLRILLIPILWIGIDVLMVPLSKIIAYTPLPVKIPTFANIRFLSMAIQLPLSVLAVYTLQYLYNRWGQKAVATVLTVFIIVTLPVYQKTFRELYVLSPYVRYYALADSETVKAAEYMNANTKPEEVVLARPESSKLLSYFINNRLYTGQQIYTQYYDYKNKIVAQLLEGKTDKCSLAKNMINGNIRYIYADNTAEVTILDKYDFLGLFYRSKIRDIPVIYTVKFQTIRFACS